MKLNEGNLLLELLIAILVTSLVVNNVVSIVKIKQAQLDLRIKYEESFY